MKFCEGDLISEVFEEMAQNLTLPVQLDKIESPSSRPSFPHPQEQIPGTILTDTLASRFIEVSMSVISA